MTKSRGLSRPLARGRDGGGSGVLSKLRFRRYSSRAFAEDALLPAGGADIRSRNALGSVCLSLSKGANASPIFFTLPMAASGSKNRPAELFFLRAWRNSSQLTGNAAKGFIPLARSE